MQDNIADNQKLTKKQRRELRRQEKQAGREKSQQSARVKKLVWTLVILVVVLGGAILAFQNSGTPSSPDDFASDNDPVKGPETASVVIEEYSDFQCPACRSASANIPEVLAAYPNDVRFVYNDYPLTTIHKNARPAAEAAQCAFAQGNFWDYHDELFAQQSSWAPLSGSALEETLIQYAGNVGLDIEAFTSCVENDIEDAAVTTDISEGNSRRVNSTPTFFVNGERHVGGKTTEDWKAVIDQAIAAAASTSSMTDEGDQESADDAS